MHTDAHIIAIEPAAVNLFCLTRTLLKLDARFRNRVALIPIGAGIRNSANTVHSTVDNLGHSVVGAPVNDDPVTPNDFLPPDTIQIRRVDHVLRPRVHITSLKIDVEGYECRTWAGFGVLRAQVNALRTEMAPVLLEAQNCSSKE